MICKKKKNPKKRKFTFGFSVSWLTVFDCRFERKIVQLAVRFQDHRTVIIMMSCRQHGYPWPSLATSPYRSSPLVGLQGYIPYPHRAARAGRPAFARPYVVVHRSKSLMSSSLLLQQCSACLVRLTWIVFVMGGRWPYSWCIVGCCRQDLFNIARSIIV